ncbi:MAG: phage tail tube protein [Chromatiales bacterium]
MPPALEANVLHTKETDAIELSNITDATVRFEADTGQRYIMRQAFTTEPVPVDSGSGKSPLRMSAKNCERVA